MNITIQAFGIAKDILSGSTTTLEVEEGSTVAEVKAILARQYPAFEKLASLRLAVNASYVSDDHRISTNDEIVLIPPVSGG
ncbi:MAG: MoaD/ThiS family protein [Cyclobacteriaceae bacterium]|nr:MoaD/ThiS family protein [Cyclobacteriaceae bacterium]